MTHQLIAIEVAGLTAVAPLQFLQLLAHGVKHRIVLVHQSVSNLETTLSDVSLVCLVLDRKDGLASDLFTPQVPCDFLGVQREHRRFNGQGRGGGQHRAGTNPGQQLRQNQKTRWNHNWFRNAISSARPF